MARSTAARPRPSSSIFRARPPSVVTTLDGHQMAKQGRAGAALGIAAIASFIAGCVATIIIAALAAPLTAMALLFGPADYFALMVLGLMFAVVLARGSVVKAIAIILVGILLSTIGTDLESGEERLTFGWTRDRRRPRRRRHRHGHVRLRRDPAQPGDDAGARRGPRRHRHAAAQSRGVQAIGMADRARHLGRLDARPAAGQRRRARPLRLLHAREEAGEGPLALRPGRDRGRGGTGVGQQRRRADRLHSAPHPRHSARTP